MIRSDIFIVALLLVSKVVFCQNNIISGSFSTYYSQNKTIAKGLLNGFEDRGYKNNYFSLRPSYLRKMNETWYVGGQLAFNSSNMKGYNIVPQLNNFITFRDTSNRNTDLGIYASARSYFMQRGNFALFGSYNIGYSSAKNIYQGMNNINEFTSNTFKISGNLNVSYEINKKWFLTTSFGDVGYSSTNTLNKQTQIRTGSNFFDISLRLSNIYFGLEYHF